MWLLCYSSAIGYKRAVELDMDTGLMTLWHDGTHTCKTKPNKELKTHYAKDNILDVNLQATPKEMKIDLIGYYLGTGQIEKAWETAELVDDSYILEKVCYTGKIPGQDHIREQDIDAYRNIGKLKATTDQKDLFHIYKLNCKVINGEPSYVFKTSSKALELAIKMDEKPASGAYQCHGF